MLGPGSGGVSLGPPLSLWPRGGCWVGFRLGRLSPSCSRLGAKSPLGVPDLTASLSWNVRGRVPFSLSRQFSQPHPHSPPPQGKTKTYQTFGLEGASGGRRAPAGAVPHPLVPQFTGWTAHPLQQLLSQALAFFLGNAVGVSQSVAAPLRSQDCSYTQELLPPARTPLPFPKSPGILRSLRNNV